MRPESGLLSSPITNPSSVAEGHQQLAPGWSHSIYSPLGHQSDPFEPQKPDHVIALFRTSTDFPSHLELKRETLSAPPRLKLSAFPSRLISDLISPASSPPAPLSHADLPEAARRAPALDLCPDCSFCLECTSLCEPCESHHHTL